MSANKKQSEMFALSPIGKLLGMNLTNNEIAEITGTSISAASKWRTGTNNATAYCQNRAKGYLEGLEKTSVNIEPVTKDTEADIMFLVSVSPQKRERFIKVLSMLNIDAVNLDE